LASSARPGRFLPGDPRVEEPYRLTPQLAFRVAILAFLALTIFAVLFLRLWALQVLSGDKYLAVANDNRVRTLRVEAPRGPVLDSNGNVLVENDELVAHGRRRVRSEARHEGTDREHREATCVWRMRVYCQMVR